MPRPALPAGVVHLELDVDDNGGRATFGIWLAGPPGWISTPDDAEALIASYVANVTPYYLAVMHAGASLLTCRLRAGGTPPLSWASVLAPNAGALSGGLTIASAAGIYVQTVSDGRGSGSRIHIPGIGHEMVDPPGRLSYYGLGQLQDLCGALAAWPPTLGPLPLGQVLLGTLQQRRAGLLLDPPRFDPAVALRPTERIENLGRRLRGNGGLSPP